MKKKTSFIVLVVMILVLGRGYVSAQTSQEQEQSSINTQDQEANANSSADAQGGQGGSALVNFNDKRVQAPQPVLPLPGPHAPFYPDKRCWKDMVYEPNELEAQEWTLEWAEAILGRVKNDWLKEEFVVKYLPTNYPRTKNVQFRCDWAWNDRRLSDYEFLDLITVAANVKWIDSRDVLAKIVKTAAKEVGADLLVFYQDNFGLQTHVLAEAGGFPLFFNIVGSNIAGTGGAGFSSSDITNDRRPFTTVRAYRHRRDKNSSSPSSLSKNTSGPAAQYLIVREGSTHKQIPIHHISQSAVAAQPKSDKLLLEEIKNLTGAVKELKETIEENPKKDQ